MTIELTELQENDIVIFRISTGEEIIGKFLTMNGRDEVAYALFDKPRVIAPVRTQQGVALTMLPFVRALDDNQPIAVDRSHILTYPVLAPKENRDMYIQETTGIQIAHLNG